MNVLAFPEHRSERAYWARRRLSPSEFAAFCDRWGIATNDSELARKHVNALLDRIEERHGRDYLTRLLAFGGERLASAMFVEWWAA